MEQVNLTSDTAVRASDWDAVTAERRARDAADKAYAESRVAFASKSRDDVLRAGDLFRYASSLYQRAADTWTRRGAEGETFAKHCTEMAKRLSLSMFARMSLAATYEPVDPAK